MSKSYKVVLSKTGRQFMTIIVGEDLCLKDLNSLIRSGMNATVIDERSSLVNKKYVDKDG